ncbi:MAG: hypothetical protein FD136_1840 [Chitinophagaceae bacterium]|nr:MAG: hypothetical protein FD136_1840 [Chitinophagaceae bacterium]
MNYLLDTHYLLWTIADTKKISKKTKDIITNSENTIIISSISFWVISGLAIEDIPQICTQMGFYIEPLSHTDSITYHHLKPDYHKDPFDKMLIWQALCNNYTLVTNDEKIKQYKALGLKIL